MIERDSGIVVEWALSQPGVRVVVAGCDNANAPSFARWSVSFSVGPA
jgi:hypothetical protein